MFTLLNIDNQIAKSYKDMLDTYKGCEMKMVQFWQHIHF